jgi:hypothetical protein
MSKLAQTPRREHERSGKKIYRAYTPPPNYTNLIDKKGLKEDIFKRSERK